MVTILTLLAIVLNAALGTLPFFGPVICGIIIGIITDKRDLSMVVAFWGAVIGGAFSRIFLSLPKNSWHKFFLNAIGEQPAYYALMVIKGNHFLLVLYFGLLALLGSYLGAMLKSICKK